MYYYSSLPCNTRFSNPCQQQKTTPSSAANAQYNSFAKVAFFYSVLESHHIIYIHWVNVCADGLLFYGLVLHSCDNSPHYIYCITCNRQCLHQDGLSCRGNVYGYEGSRWQPSGKTHLIICPKRQKKEQAGCSAVHGWLRHNARESIICLAAL